MMPKKRITRRHREYSEQVFVDLPSKAALLNFTNISEVPQDLNQNTERLTDHESEFYKQVRLTSLRKQDSYVDRIEQYVDMYNWGDAESERLRSLIMKSKQTNGGTLVKDSRIYRLPEGTPDTDVLVLRLDSSELAVYHVESNNYVNFMGSKKLVQSLQVTNLDAFSFGEFIANTAKELFPELQADDPEHANWCQTSRMKCVIAVSFPLDDRGLAFLSLGNLCEAAHTEDPLIGVEVPALVNNAFRRHKYMANCLAAINIECAALCAAVARGYTSGSEIPNLVTSVCIGADLHIGVTAPLRAESVAYRLAVGAYATAMPRTVVDACLLFDIAKTAATSSTLSGDSMAQLLRLIMCRVLQDEAPIECFYFGCIHPEFLYMVLMEQPLKDDRSFSDEGIDPDLPESFVKQQEYELEIIKQEQRVRQLYIVEQIVVRAFPSIEGCPSRTEKICGLFQKFALLILSRTIDILATCLVSITEDLHSEVLQSTVMLLIAFDEEQHLDFGFNANDVRARFSDELLQAIGRKRKQRVVGCQFFVDEDSDNVPLGAAAFVTKPAIFNNSRLDRRIDKLCVNRGYKMKNQFLDIVKSPYCRESQYNVELQPFYPCSVQNMTTSTLKCLSARAEARRGLTDDNTVL